MTATIQSVSDLASFRGRRVYLASPYSSDLPALREWRASRAARAMLWLVHHGVAAYAPVPHGHYAETVAGPAAPGIGYRQWIDHGLVMLRGCHAMMVLMLPDYEASRGVETERAEAVRHGLMVYHLPPAVAFAGTPFDAPFDRRGPVVAEANVSADTLKAAGWPVNSRNPWSAP